MGMLRIFNFWEVKALRDLNLFEKSVKDLSKEDLQKVLKDIKLRIEDARLSDHGAYFKQQKRREAIVLQELESR